MGSHLAFDIVVKKAIEMKDRSCAGKFPEQATLWQDLLANDVANFLPIGVALFDRNFVLLKCNKLYQDYINTYSCKSSKQAIGMEYFDLFASARSSLLEIFTSVRNDMRQHTSHEFPVPLDVRITQNATYWDAKLIPVRDDQNRPAGLLLSTLDVTELVLAEQQLQQKELEIMDLKTTLRTIMKLRQEDQVIWEQKAMANVKKIIEPFLSNLRSSLVRPDQISNLEGIEAGINEFVYEFSYLLSSEQYLLTPKEIQVAALIKIGKSTKEIAECFFVSPASIDFHRKNIRTKLNLKNKKINLQSYLTSSFKP